MLNVYGTHLVSDPFYNHRPHESKMFILFLNK